MQCYLKVVSSQLHKRNMQCRNASDSPAFLENILTDGPAGPLGGPPIPGPPPMLPIGALGNIEGGGGGGLF